MSANEKLRSIAYAMGFTMTADQNKAYGELKGFPVLFSVASEDEILVQFHASSNEPTAKQNVATDIDKIKEENSSVRYGSFSGEKANIGFNTQNPTFDTEYNTTLSKLAESLQDNHCKVICECCKEETQVHAVAIDDEIQMTCEKCGFIAYNDTLSCVQWCQYARKCVGDEMYEVMMKIAAEQTARK